MSARIGLGYDVHRLKPGKGFPLGGVWIPCDVSVEAHSDGDVLCHAAADALLGAAGMGDIGEHFPDSDDRWRGARGAELIAIVVNKLSEKGLRPVQLDSIVLLQSPRLGGYKTAIRRSLAAMLGLSGDEVNIKAATTEGLDAVGQHNAVAAWVAAVIEAS